MSNILNSKNTEVSVIAERVPHNPSTPSEQLVTLMLTHIRITISIPYITGLSVTVSLKSAISNVPGL